MKREISITNIFRLSMPATFYYATVMLVGVVDLLFIGQLGTTAIASAAVGVSICSAIYAFLDGIRTSTSVLTAQFLGAKNANKIKETLISSLILSLGLGLILLPFIPSFSSFIFHMIGNQELYNQGIPYLTIRLYSMPFLLLIFGIVGFFRGLYNTSIQLVIAMTTCVTNIFLDYVLIYGKLGFPTLGIKGAALATLTAEAAGTLIGIIILLTNKLTKEKLSLKLPSFTLMKQHAKISIESGMYNGFAYLAVSTFALIFSSLGTQAMAINQIGSQIFFISYLPQMGLFVAVSIIVGKLLGAKTYNLIIPTVIRVTTIAALLALLIGGGILFFSKEIIQLFSPGDKVVMQGVLAILSLICLDQFVSSAIVVLKGALTGINDSRFISIIMIFSGYGLFIPLAYILGFTYRMGLIGGYIAFVAWSVIDLFIFTARLHYLKNKQLLSAVTTTLKPSQLPSLKQEDYDGSLSI